MSTRKYPSHNFHGEESTSAKNQRRIEVPTQEKTVFKWKTIPDTFKASKPMGKHLAVSTEHTRFETTHNNARKIPKPQTQNTETCKRTNNNTRTTRHLLP